MHQPIPDQGRWLKQVVTGFFAYHCGFRSCRPGIPIDVGHLIPIEAGHRFRSMSAGVASARWSVVVCHRCG
jgi:hypothetical protein